MNLSASELSVLNPSAVQTCARFLCASYQPDLPNFKFHASESFSLLLSALASSQVTRPPPPPHPSCVRNTFRRATTPAVPPAPTNTLHPSHVLKFISLSLSLPLSLPSSSSWSAHFPPFHLAYLSPLLSLLSDSLITLYQSGLRGARAQCSIASHSPSLVPSVPVSLPSLPQSL